MKKLEKVFWGLFIIGLLFKIMHWPGAAILTVFSLGLVSSLYFYFGFGLFNSIKFRNIFKKESYATISSGNLIFGVGFGLALSILVIGFLFKFMLWPGANLMLSIGLALLIIALLAYLIFLKMNKVSLPKGSFFRVILVFVLSLSLYLIQSDSIIEFYYPNDKPYANALKNLVKDPGNVEYQKAFEKVREKRMLQNIKDRRGIDLEEEE